MNWYRAIIAFSSRSQTCSETSSSAKVGACRKLASKVVQEVLWARVQCYDRPTWRSEVDETVFAPLQRATHPRALYLWIVRSFAFTPILRAPIITTGSSSLSHMLLYPSLAVDQDQTGRTLLLSIRPSILRASGRLRTREPLGEQHRPPHPGVSGDRLQPRSPISGLTRILSGISHADLTINENFLPSCSLDSHCL